MAHRAPELSDDLRRFIVDRVSTPERLEVLMLLWRKREHSFSGQEVGDALHISVSEASTALDALCRANLLDVRIGSEEVHFRYAPGQPELGPLVEQLARARDERLLEIIKLMPKPVPTRSDSGARSDGARGEPGRSDTGRLLRRSAIDSFADAFVLRRKKREDG